jgi:hypothetical protein
MNSPLTAALVRALITAVFTFGAVTLSTYQASLRVLEDGSVIHGSWELALISGGSAAMSILLARVGGEGLYDQNRDNANPPAVEPSDVGVKA